MERSNVVTSRVSHKTLLGDESNLKKSGKPHARAGGECHLRYSPFGGWRSSYPFWIRKVIQGMYERDMNCEIISMSLGNYKNDHLQLAPYHGIPTRPSVAEAVVQKSMQKVQYDEEGNLGRWVTIQGIGPLFIVEGESLEDAIKRRKDKDKKKERDKEKSKDEKKVKHKKRDRTEDSEREEAAEDRPQTPARAAENKNGEDDNENGDGDDPHKLRDGAASDSEDDYKNNNENEGADNENTEEMKAQIFTEEEKREVGEHTLFFPKKFPEGPNKTYGLTRDDPEHTPYVGSEDDLEHVHLGKRPGDPGFHLRNEKYRLKKSQLKLVALSLAKSLELSGIQHVRRIAFHGCQHSTRLSS